MQNSFNIYGLTVSFNCILNLILHWLLPIYICTAGMEFFLNTPGKIKEKSRNFDLPFEQQPWWMWPAKECSTDWYVCDKIWALAYLSLVSWRRILHWRDLIASTCHTLRIATPLLSCLEWVTSRVVRSWWKQIFCFYWQPHAR